jgi:hypothetical protein
MPAAVDGAAAVPTARLCVASFIDPHKKKRIQKPKNRAQSQTPGENGSLQRQVPLNALCDESDRVILVHGLLEFYRTTSPDRMQQKLSRAE